MEQQFKSQVVVTINESGGTPTSGSVKFEKAYLNRNDVWGIAGDGGIDDPGDAIVIILTTNGDAVPGLSDTFYYTGLCAETYTYTLTIDGTSETYVTGVYLDGGEKQKDIAANTAHVSSDGKNHTDVVLCNTHRALVTTNPHGVDTSLANGVNLPSVQNYSVAEMNALENTLTNKTITKPIIESIYQDAGKTKLFALPLTVGGGDFADNADMLSDDEFLAKLVDGSANSNSALSYISNLMSDSAVVGRIMAEQKRTSYISGTVTPVATVIPDYVGQEYLDTVTGIWYKAVDLLAANWKAMNA